MPLQMYFDNYFIGSNTMTIKILCAIINNLWSLRMLNDTVDCNGVNYGCAQKLKIVTSDLVIICDVITVRSTC